MAGIAEFYRMVSWLIENSTTLTVIIGITLLLGVVVIPVLKESYRAEQRRFKNWYRLFKLRTVALYHPAIQEDPELRRLSASEIAERYNIEREFESFELRRQ